MHFVMGSREVPESESYPYKLNGRADCLHVGGYEGSTY